MQLAEIRELDGPNMFLAEPAIKIEFVFDSEADVAHARDRAVARLASAGVDVPDGDALLGDVFTRALAHLSPVPPASTSRTLDTKGHLVFAFGWKNRREALYIADSLADLLRADAEDVWPGPVPAPEGGDERPLWIRNEDRRAKIVAVTGTNGKTTTTRLIAHLASTAGASVGWSSSSGVYINGAEVLQGDYSGPSGARRVLEDERVDIAVLESARGGILLRGLAFENCDVSVFTNVSADHLGLQGINTIESLANVKSIVVKTTGPKGVSVLNADDAQVMRATASINVRKLLVAQEEDHPLIAAHVASGGDAVVVAEGAFTWLSVERRTAILPVADAPVTFEGHAKHMVENALCAVGAAIGLGLTPPQIAEGLRSFSNSAGQNPGRLNIFDVDGITVVLDFAHNSAGLSHLLTFARSLAPEPAHVLSVIGTAGDRESAVLLEIGRIAGAQSDVVIIKKTGKYLRGRTHREMRQLFERGISEKASAPPLHADSELQGLELAILNAAPGDAVVIMCHEQIEVVIEYLTAIGTPRSS